MCVLISVDFTCVTPIFTVAAVDESGFGLQGRSLPEISAINENSFYSMALLLTVFPLVYFYIWKMSVEHRIFFFFWLILALNDLSFPDFVVKRKELSLRAGGSDLAL